MSQAKKKQQKLPISETINPQFAQVNYNTYMFQVKEHVAPVILNSLQLIYNDACKYCEEEQLDEAQRFKVFQKALGDIKHWSDEELEEETEEFMGQVPWLRDVLRQILVSQVHILLSARADKYVPDPKFEFSMPSEDQIVFKFLVRAAKTVKPRARLFDHQLEDEEIDANLIEAEEVVRKSIERTIHTLVPIEKIVESHFGPDPLSKIPKQPRKAAKKEEKEEKETSEGSAEHLAKENQENNPLTTEEREEIEQEVADEEQYEEQKQAEIDRLREAGAKHDRMELLDGEEHVDEDVEAHIERLMLKLEQMDRGDPRRRELKHELKKLLK